MQYSTIMVPIELIKNPITTRKSISPYTLIHGKTKGRSLQRKQIINLLKGDVSPAMAKDT